MITQEEAVPMTALRAGPGLSLWGNTLRRSPLAGRTSFTLVAFRAQDFKGAPFKFYLAIDLLEICNAIHIFTEVTFPCPVLLS